MNPKRYKSVPELKVIETQAPLLQEGGQASLNGLVIGTGDDSW